MQDRGSAGRAGQLRRRRELAARGWRWPPARPGGSDDGPAIPTGEIELLAGQPVAAEAFIRAGCDALSGWATTATT